MTILEKLQKIQLELKVSKAQTNAFGKYKYRSAEDILESVKPFEEKYGASVSVTYVGSVDEMFAKMQGSKGADFDVVSFDTSSFKRYIDNGLIQPIDRSSIFLR